MDLNLTVAIPATGVIILANTIVNLLRYLHVKKNGTEVAMLEGLKEGQDDIREGQEKCAQCFKELSINGAKSEAHLETIVQQLQLLNTNISNWRR